MRARVATLLAVSLSMVMVASTAVAGVEFTVVNGASTTIPVGGTVVVSINVANVGATPALRQSVSGFGASIFGYNQAVADFVTGSGRAAKQFFGSCGTDPEDPTGCIGGLTQANNAFFSPSNLVENIVGGNHRIQIIAAASTTPTNRSGVGDFGWDDTFTTPDMIVTFQGIAEGTTTLRIGTGFPGDALILADTTAVQVPEVTFTITVPEPATWAAGLASLGTVAGLIGIRRKLG